MATGPKKITENIEAECDAFEKLIDEKIEEQSSNRFEINAPKDFENKHFLVLKKRYLDAGWTNVTFKESYGAYGANGPKILIFYCADQNETDSNPLGNRKDDYFNK